MQPQISVAQENTDTSKWLIPYEPAEAVIKRSLAKWAKEKPAEKPTAAKVSKVSSVPASPSAPSVAHIPLPLAARMVQCQMMHNALKDQAAKVRALIARQAPMQVGIQVGQLQVRQLQDQQALALKFQQLQNSLQAGLTALRASAEAAAKKPGK